MNWSGVCLMRLSLNAMAEFPVPLISALPLLSPPQSFHSSCNNVSEPFSPSLPSSSSSSSSPSPCSSATSSPESPTPSSSPASSCSGAWPKPAQASQHKRSVSMTSLPVYNRQVADSCIVRVSVDLAQNNGNLYKSIMVSSSPHSEQGFPPH